MNRTEYAVQAMSRSTGSSGRWLTMGRIYHRADQAHRFATERREANGHRAVYRVVSREVTPWQEVAQ